MKESVMSATNVPAAGESHVIDDYTAEGEGAGDLIVD